MPYENILYDAEDGVARITLNRPEKLNALSWPMQQEIREAFWATDGAKKASESKA